VVRTSVFGWLTFPDLRAWSIVDMWPLRGWGVRYGSTTQANSAFYPFRIGNEYSWSFIPWLQWCHVDWRSPQGPDRGVGATTPDWRRRHGRPANTWLIRTIEADLRPINYRLQTAFCRAGLTNVGALFGKICGAYPQDQNERPNDHVRVQFLSYNFNVNFCIQYCSAYFRL